MSGEIDVKALGEEGKGEFVSRPITFSKHPDKKNNFYGYRVKFIQEPRSFTSKAGNTYDCADGLLIEVVNDPDVEVGKEYTWILPKVLRKKLLEKGKGTITGKTFDWAGRGKREPKKKGARPYYDFGVMIKEGTLAWSMLRRILPIGRKSLEDKVEQAGEFIESLSDRIERDLETLTQAEVEAEERIAEIAEILSDIEDKKTRLTKLEELL